MSTNKPQLKAIKDYGKRVNMLVDEFEQQIHEHLNEEYNKSTTFANRLADRIASFGGSWRFIMIFCGILLSWIVVNTLSVTKILHFDEPPFILLNLVLSFLAGFQAPIIIMSQNRQATRDKRESIIDYAINYKAEQEIVDIQEHLHQIKADFGMFRQEVQTELAEIKSLLLEKSSNNSKDE